MLTPVRSQRQKYRALSINTGLEELLPEQHRRSITEIDQQHSPLEEMSDG